MAAVNEFCVQHRCYVITFYDFLQTRRADDNPLGDFVKDAQHDIDLQGVDSIVSLFDHLRDRAAFAGAYELAAILWLEYVIARRNN